MSNFGDDSSVKNFELYENSEDARKTVEVNIVMRKMRDMLVGLSADVALNSCLNLACMIIAETSSTKHNASKAVRNASFLMQELIEANFPNDGSSSTPDVRSKAH